MRNAASATRFLARLRHAAAIGVLAASIAVISGCAGNDERDARSGATELFERARKSMDNGNYDNAIRYYEALEARYPFSNESKQAQLDLIFCYYKDRQIEATVDAASTFERENPTHPRVDYALYMRGLAYFGGQHTWYHRWFNVDLARRPPKSAQESFSVLSQLVQRFPDSAYAEDARLRMTFLRNRLAAYENYVARYYLTRSAWLAAANRAEFAVARYSGAPSIPESLAIMLEAYEQLGMTPHVDDTRRVLAASYPGKLEELEREISPPWYKFW